MPIFEYALTDEEKVSLQKFLKKHDKICPGVKDNYSINFVPVVKGVIVESTCKECGESKNITDYSTW